MKPIQLALTATLSIGICDLASSQSPDEILSQLYDAARTFEASFDIDAGPDRALALLDRFVEAEADAADDPALIAVRTARGWLAAIDDWPEEPDAEQFATVMEACRLARRSEHAPLALPAVLLAARMSPSDPRPMLMAGELLGLQSPLFAPESALRYYARTEAQIFDSDDQIAALMVLGGMIGVAEAFRNDPAWLRGALQLRRRRLEQGNPVARLAAADAALAYRLSAFRAAAAIGDQASVVGHLEQACELRSDLPVLLLLAGRARCSVGPEFNKSKAERHLRKAEKELKAAKEQPADLVRAVWEFCGLTWPDFGAEALARDAKELLVAVRKSEDWGLWYPDRGGLRDKLESWAEKLGEVGARRTLLDREAIAVAKCDRLEARYKKAKRAFESAGPGTLGQHIDRLASNMQDAKHDWKAAVDKLEEIRIDIVGYREALERGRALSELYAKNAR